MKAYLLIFLAVFVSPSAFAEKTLQECIDTENDLERLVCYDSVFGHNKSRDSYQPNINLPKNQSPSKAENFGKEQVKTEISKELSEISAVAKGSFKKWTKGMVITLDNGQEWKIMSERALSHKIKNPHVKISKGFLGSYKLSIEGINTRLNVRRVK